MDIIVCSTLGTSAQGLSLCPVARAFWCHQPVTLSVNWEHPLVSHGPLLLLMEEDTGDTSYTLPQVPEDRCSMHLAWSPHTGILTSLHFWHLLTPERKNKAKAPKEQWSSVLITPLIARGLLLEFPLLRFYQMLYLLHWAVISWVTSSGSTLSRSRTSFENSFNLSPKGEMKININFLFLFQFSYFSSRN